MNKFYKNKLNQVFSFSPIQKIPSDLIPLTEEEINLHLNPPLDVEQLKTDKRLERDKLIKDIEWRVSRYEQQLRLGLQTNDTEQTYLDILTYIQTLRDIPDDNEFPYLKLPIFE